jgi:hypothetical protein
MKHSDRDTEESGTSTLMVYSTLCAATESTTLSCDEHPEYARHLRDPLPGVCVEKHGQPVVRSRLGSLKHKFKPLCQQRPTIPATCDLKHGTLQGHQGQSTTDLESQQPILQQGFWKKENSVFSRTVSDHLQVLRLLPSDIGGHCLDFKITANGWLYLDRAPLDCQEKGGNICDWLQNIESNWAGEHEFVERHLDVNPLDNPSESVSWQCPLHWLWRFHDDNSRHQARAPSWLRNRPGSDTSQTSMNTRTQQCTTHTSYEVCTQRAG